ncbi:superoxide dismutase family protein [Novosphingobium sp. ZN18A2]|uniref:superoxide dismutase family protein n=1 Tax=Novosphingobium sp. ZN18A2 TaxID=3079861 RepID=UPI0030CF8E04
MRKPNGFILALAATPLFAACATIGGPRTEQVAAAGLLTANGTSVGEARFMRTGDRLEMLVSAYGLPPGPHGIHLHTTGSCVAPGFTSAGGHLNPGGSRHGMNNPRGRHLGDLPNLEVGHDGSGRLTVPLPGPADAIEADLFDADGTAVVIHAGPDDYRTDPSGNSGGRIACSVVSRG